MYRELLGSTTTTCCDYSTTNLTRVQLDDTAVTREIRSDLEIAFAGDRRCASEQAFQLIILSRGAQCMRLCSTLYISFNQRRTSRLGARYLPDKVKEQGIATAS